VALGACGYALQAGCYFAALARIDASLLSLLLYTFPAIVAAAAVALGRERIAARRVTALALASAGLVLVLAGAGPGRSIRSAPDWASGRPACTARTSSSAKGSPGDRARPCSR
jgi:drug/metabolite transporter (DMT)-like permease